jgi:hypothetical protein
VVDAEGAEAAAGGDDLDVGAAVGAGEAGDERGLPVGLDLADGQGAHAGMGAPEGEGGGVVEREVPEGGAIHRAAGGADEVQAAEVAHELRHVGVVRDLQVDGDGAVAGGAARRFAGGEDVAVVRAEAGEEAGEDALGLVRPPVTSAAPSMPQIMPDGRAQPSAQV